ncbi:hypothetical protein BDV24DRAFT_160149 [Aspergillus arachidicola]|uniref:F-box domain-containing protein n=1 Tax=Aspergillus arachidicola TaxID=656916 RepID=A0A5N6YJT9_9EURO|nr:hypothetical protein BDV24DRAFT_160149 [Aspergillus arachidicola]
MGDDYLTLSLRPTLGHSQIYFHELCWERLEDHFSPGKIKLDALPGILSFLRSRQDPAQGPPFYMPSLGQLLQEHVRIPDRTPEVAKQLAILPLEIKEIIAEQLCTCDFLCLQTVSRAMNGIFFSPRVWRSRFDINKERGFLYRAVKDSSNKTEDGINWQHLYHCIFTLPRNDKFDEMVKMWETFRWINDVCLREETAQTPLLDFQGRALQHSHGTQLAGTKVETVDISPELAKAGVSIFCENDQYALITGLAFHRQGKSCEVIGYKIPGARTLSEKEMASRI